MNQFADRKYILGAIVVIAGLVLITRLFFLQVMNTSYKESASSNSQRIVTQQPARGLIYDRHNELLVYNVAAYDLNINPNELRAFDTVELASYLNVSIKDIRDGVKAALEYSPYAKSQLRKVRLLTAEEYAFLQEKLYRFPGFYVEPRTIRKYTHNIAPHAIGYVGEADEKILKKNEYYRLGDYIGISGVEKAYEELLRGEKGQKILLVDAKSRIRGSYMDGAYDRSAVVGKNITLTIDRELQEYAEGLMMNKIGSIVAIEPSSGEILTIVSTPTYDPALLSGKDFSNNYKVLSKDSLKPLYDRSCQAIYPPGSIFKMVQALIALQDGVITPYNQLYCDGSLVGDHAPPGYYDIKTAIIHSSNNFFYKIFKLIIEQDKAKSQFEDSEIGFKLWREQVLSFGFGQKLGSDLVHEKGGVIPTKEYYDRMYGVRRWKTSTIISNSIGQGEILIVPLQMANLVAAIGNHGYFYTPHLLKKVNNEPIQIPQFTQRRRTAVDSIHFEPIIDAMEAVVRDGTGKGAAIPGIKVCGKTGTAQNAHGKDHSVFVAFAPRQNPKIAIAVYVENAGWGGEWAAPLASLIMEKYLTDTVTRPDIETYIRNASFMYTPR